MAFTSALTDNREACPKSDSPKKYESLRWDVSILELSHLNLAATRPSSPTVPHPTSPLGTLPPPPLQPSVPAACPKSFSSLREPRSAFPEVLCEISPPYVSVRHEGKCELSGECSETHGSQSNGSACLPRRSCSSSNGVRGKGGGSSANSTQLLCCCDPFPTRLRVGLQHHLYIIGNPYGNHAVCQHH